MSATTSALQQGQRRYRQERRKDAIRRVRAYQRWLKAGSDFRAIPAIPSDHDFKIARAAGR